jgi:L-fuconolactonase
MYVIDSHQHFWQYHPNKQNWMDDSMSAIRRDFLPKDLEPVLQENNIAGCVTVQADQSEEETDFLLAFQKQHSFIKGVVGWVDLQSEDVDSRLAYYSQNPAVKGFRHVLQSEAPEFMLRPDFIRGIAALQKFNFTYDILIFPKHLPAAIELVKQFSHQKFVIDHMAKPYIKAGLIEEWKTDIKKIAAFENVFCKISGLVTEADFHHWKIQDFRPYLDVAVEAFGVKRILYGSDWPVCLVAASYQQTKGIVDDYFASFSNAEQEDFFGRNAVNFYQL